MSFWGLSVINKLINLSTSDNKFSAGDTYYSWRTTLSNVERSIVRLCSHRGSDRWFLGNKLWSQLTRLSMAGLKILTVIHH